MKNNILNYFIIYYLLKFKFHNDTKPLKTVFMI